MRAVLSTRISFVSVDDLFSFDSCVFRGVKKCGATAAIIVRVLVTYHCLETLTYELGLELWTGEASGNALIGENLICEVGTGFEGERLGLYERVVAVEENGGDLLVVSISDLLCNVSNVRGYGEEEIGRVPSSYLCSGKIK